MTQCGSTERESPADLAKYGLSDARIVTWKSVPYKRMLEYLFYIHNPNIADTVGNIQDIMERGFKPIDRYLVSLLHLQSNRVRYSSGRVPNVEIYRF